MLFIFAFSFFVCLMAIFVLAPMPGRIARKRNHPQAKTIKTCGWVAILSSSPGAWIIAMKWAYNDHLESQMIAFKKAKRRKNSLKHR